MSRPSFISHGVPLLLTTTIFSSVSRSPITSSTRSLTAAVLPLRAAPSTVISTLASENSMRSRTASAEKPPKTTLCGAPMRAQASIATPRDHMAIQAVVGDVERAAHEPLVEGRVVVVEHAVPLLEPVELLCLCDPPRLRVRGRLLVDRGVFQQCLLAKARGGLERLDVEQLGKLGVELRAADSICLSAHRSRSSLSKIRGRTLRGGHSPTGVALTARSGGTPARRCAR